MIKHSRKDAKFPLKSADPEPEPELGPDSEVAQYEKPWVESLDAENGNDAEQEPVGQSDEENPKNATPVVEEVTDSANEWKDDAADEDKDPADGWKDEETKIIFTDMLINLDLGQYLKAKAIMSPNDPKMKMINSVL